MTRGVRWLVLLAMPLVVLGGPGCRRKASTDLGDQGTTPRASTLPALTLKDDTADLLLTWVDAKGDAHTTVKPADVPTEGRDQVRVVVTTQDEGTHELFYVANLTVQNRDGTYPVSTTPRSEWEGIIEKRRQALIAANTPAEEAPADPGGAAAGPRAAPAVNFTVIVYGASWCGACHQAMAYLKKRHIPAIEKDVEADPRAQAEMQQKLARAGQQGGSIPVIDVKGTLLVGFEPHALEAAIRATGGGTAL
jgi:glutaredoxin